MIMCFIELFFELFFGGYVYCEFFVLCCVVFWLVLIVLFVGLGYLIFCLEQILLIKGFFIYFVLGGWKKFLLFLFVVSGVLVFISLFGQCFGQFRIGKNISYLVVLGDQFIYLFLILVVLVVVYLLFYVLFVVFDFNNSFFVFLNFINFNIFYCLGLLLQFEKLIIENFVKFFEVVIIFGY